MNNTKLIKQIVEISNTQQDHSDFYELAEEYGFCTPWCDGCECCEELVSSMV